MSQPMQPIQSIQPPPLLDIAELTKKMSELELMGFNNRFKNMRLLEKYQGDIDRVLESLRRSPHHCDHKARSRHHHEHEQEQNTSLSSPVKLQPLAVSKPIESEPASALALPPPESAHQPEEHATKYGKRSKSARVRHLRGRDVRGASSENETNANRDVARVRAVLAECDASEAKLADQLTDKKLARLLHKHGSDVETTAVAALNQLQRMARRQEKQTRMEDVLQRYDSQIKALQQVAASMNFNLKPHAMARLIHRYNEDCERATQALKEKLERRLKRKRLRESFVTHPVAQLAVKNEEHESDDESTTATSATTAIPEGKEADQPDVESSAVKLAPCAARHEEVKEFSAELTTLERMGYTLRPGNLRLLKRFKGDVNKVAAELTARQERRGHNDEETDEGTQALDRCHLDTFPRVACF